ncbi:RIO-like serine/threonine kinase [Thermogladius calderae 1633]|uniref:non-specific serine/threonine protein kinase n=1 Tax=Thermogladius calderae (strain DSM 22663 / VKM B-2946 / 1633) TaxID=1184251 RepID=I3TCG0_THEC1|nr:RIO1 family regulatory kinase/ATPase [Thermogladius calderae]AFK50448.1 RIO-like serine/threonine kinase [Thermogladius calderae 1633]
MPNLGLIYRSLNEDDFKVLRAMERLSKRRDFIPLEDIVRETRIYEEKASLVLHKLHKLKLVKSALTGPSRSFRLTYLALDMLALKSLVDQNIVSAIGDKVGVGKESDLYKAMSPSGEALIIKFLRIGRSSFRRTRLLRSWAQSPTTTWFEQSKAAAEREYKALVDLYSNKANVPRPYGFNRHATVMEFIDGVELYRRPTLRDPWKVLEQIFETLRIAYSKVGIVHGDLSEYNIIVSKNDERPYIIDWPQFVYKEEPNALPLLSRDVKYILRFFGKVYGVGGDPGEVVKYITS